MGLKGPFGLIAALTSRPVMGQMLRPLQLAADPRPWRRRALGKRAWRGPRPERCLRPTLWRLVMGGGVSSERARAPAASANGLARRLLGRDRADASPAR